MRTLQTFQKRHHHTKQVRLFKRPPSGLPSCEHIRQRTVILLIHHHVRCAVGSEAVPTRNDTRVGFEVHQRPGILPKASQAVSVSATVFRIPDPHHCPFAHGQFSRQVLLDGNGRARLGVLGPVDDGEAAVPNHGLEGVPT